MHKWLAGWRTLFFLLFVLLNYSVDKIIARARDVRSHIFTLMSYTHLYKTALDRIALPAKKNERRERKTYEKTLSHFYLFLFFFCTASTIHSVWAETHMYAHIPCVCVCAVR